MWHDKSLFWVRLKLTDVNLLPEKLCQIDYGKIEQHLHLFQLVNAMENIK